MRRFTFALLVPVLLVVSTISAVGKEISRDFHKSFDVKEGATLHLRHGDGDVTITPWDKDVVDIEVHYRAEARSVGVGGRVDFDVEFSQSREVIEVIGRERITGSVGFRYFKCYQYTYDISAPRYVILDLEGEDGDVYISDWRAKIDCFLEDGDIELDDIISPRTQIEVEDGDVNIDQLEGDLLVDAEDGDVDIRRSKTPSCRVNLEDGDLTIRQSEGDFEVDVEDGNVDLSELRAEVLEIWAADGDIDLNILKTDNVDWDISTEDGDVTVVMEKGISASFAIETDEGLVRVDLPSAADLRKKRHRASGELYGGEGRIRINTSDGDVTLRESD